VDLGRLGYIGHSLGGDTVVGLAGGWSSWKTPGVKAVLALSPYTEPKYFVDFNRAGHLAWTDLRNTAHAEINAYAIAFLDHYVLGTPSTSTLTQAWSGVAELRFDSELGHAGRSAESGGRPARVRPRSPVGR
jgi:hypothetical protein